MSEALNENSLKSEFRRLRETEMHAAPGYRQPLPGNDRPAPRRRLQPVLKFALVALVLVALTAVLFDSGFDQSMPESAASDPAALAPGDRVVAFDMPTDFLLDTPWFDLAASTPDFDSELPQYDIPEDLLDET